MSLPQEKKFLHALALAGAEYDALQKIYSALGSYEAAWQADTAALASAGISRELIERLARIRTELNPDDAMRSLVAEGIALVMADEPEFPAELREIASPPLALYMKGKVGLDLPRLAVVGTRKATAYGREATQKIIRDIASQTEIAIVSGLATGIDTEAHRAALAHGLITVGVLGSGMDHTSFFPPENWNLAEDIISNGGAVISEYPPGAPALKHHFPARNRIIAGLAKGALVIEAPERSGALITARFAMEQGRDVFAVPGQLFSQSAIGAHRLIQDGAKLVMKAEDIIAELGLPRRARADAAAFGGGGDLTDDTSRTILSLLGEPKSVDELKEETDLATPDIIARLSLLELNGLIRSLGQNRFGRTT
ncbi:MAG: DNA-protecting protein DprA [Candidatus Sungbacteria bacterium]|uniref:DNA-protecting protein DprA n=1 Tax=Candidatus Sungiibacteriota bacterium TaxID=2750080 RepID=A0A932YVA5_9BACT|nr:DNA-protecting protein DprA [Candidatus Sungbacteria bacterium]